MDQGETVQFECSNATFTARSRQDRKSTEATVNLGGTMQLECSNSEAKVSQVKWYNDNNQHMISAFSYERFDLLLDEATEDEKSMMFKSPKYFTWHVYENIEPGRVVEKFEMYNNTGVIITIDKTTDLNHQFAIDADGVLRIQRPLDREKEPRTLLRILAIKDSLPVQTATATFTVIIDDVNDNAPQLKVDQAMIMETVRENDKPDDKITEIFGQDADDAYKGNGPPYHMCLAPSASDEIKQKFSVEWNHKGDDGHGSAIVYSKVAFDRELKKKYLIPIQIKDAGTPMMTGTSTLTVTIGDRNNNKLKEGHKTVTVYRYGTQDQEMPVGRVYAYDKDDWDIMDLSYSWQGLQHPQFELNEQTGMVTMKPGILYGIYDLKFFVKDRFHNQIDIRATMRVRVRNIPDEAFQNSVTVKITGLSPKGLLTALKEIPSNSTDYVSNAFLTKNIKFLSIQKVQEKSLVTQVTFVRICHHYDPVHFSKGYYQKARELKHLVHRFGYLMAALLGAQSVELVNADHCKEIEQNLLILSTPILVDANDTAHVGIATQVKCSQINKLDLKISANKSDFKEMIYKRCEVNGKSTHNRDPSLSSPIVTPPSFIPPPLDVSCQRSEESPNVCGIVIHKQQEFIVTLLWLQCYFIHSEKLYSVTWYENGIEIYHDIPEKNNRYWTDDIRISEEKSGISRMTSEIDIHNLVLTAINNSTQGEYTCEVKEKLFGGNFVAKNVTTQLRIYGRDTEFSSEKVEFPIMYPELDTSLPTRRHWWETLG